MPYIKCERRDALRLGSAMQDAGELNYKVSRMVRDYLFTHGMSYQTINDIVGALECAKAEFQRRFVGEHEDKKIKENGDVY